MRNGGACHHRLVVSKMVGLGMDRNSQILQTNMESNDLICSNSGSHKLRTISCCLYSRLSLGEPFHRSTIQQMQDPSSCSSSEQAMVQVCIHIGGSQNRITKWCGDVIWDVFMYPSINSIFPVIDLVFKL